MRIVVINGSTDLYGANRILSLSLHFLAKHGDITVLLPDLNGPLVQYIHENNPGVVVKKYDKLPIIQRSMFSFRGIMQALNFVSSFYVFLKQENVREKIDLLYVNTLSNFLVLPISNMLKIKTLMHVHEILESPASVSNFINRYTLRWSNHILAVSHAVKANLLRNSSKKMGGKITVIHNGIPDMYMERTPVDGINPTCIITFIGRIKPEKGVWYFLEALALLPPDSPVFVRIIGGPAPFGEKHVERLKKDILKIGVEIEYIPFTPDVKKLLNETDILVVPSTAKDPFPTTVLEGMSAGKAVIATNTGGAVEAIVDETSGFIISNDDARDFAKKISLLLNDAVLRDRVGKDARRRYLTNFSVDVYNRNMVAFYAKILSSNN